MTQQRSNNPDYWKQVFDNNRERHLQVGLAQDSVRRPIKAAVPRTEFTPEEFADAWATFAATSEEQHELTRGQALEWILRGIGNKELTPLASGHIKIRDLRDWLEANEVPIPPFLMGLDEAPREPDLMTTLIQQVREMDRAITQLCGQPPSQDALRPHVVTLQERLGMNPSQSIARSIVELVTLWSSETGSVERRGKRSADHKESVANAAEVYLSAISVNTT